MYFKGNIAVFHATNWNKIWPMIFKNFQGRLKKSATTVTNVYEGKYCGSLCNKLKQVLSKDV